jgi:hypothetical protein
MRPATKAAALKAWRARSLAILTEIRLATSAVESLVRAGVTGHQLEDAVEVAWDQAGRLASVSIGPETSAEELAEANR